MAKVKFDSDGVAKLDKRTLARVMSDQKLARVFGTMWATAMGEVLMGPDYGWDEETTALLTTRVISKASEYVKAAGK